MISAMTRKDLVRAVEATVALAGTSDPTWGSLAEYDWEAS